jgi:hypothetical protein
MPIPKYDANRNPANKEEPVSEFILMTYDQRKTSPTRSERGTYQMDITSLERGYEVQIQVQTPHKNLLYHFKTHNNTVALNITKGNKRPVMDWQYALGKTNQEVPLVFEFMHVIEGQTRDVLWVVDNQRFYFTESWRKERGNLVLIRQGMGETNQ